MHKHPFLSAFIFYTRFLHDTLHGNDKINTIEEKVLPQSFPPLPSLLQSELLDHKETNMIKLRRHTNTCCMDYNKYIEQCSTTHNIYGWITKFVAGLATTSESLQNVIQTMFNPAHSLVHSLHVPPSPVYPNTLSILVTIMNKILQAKLQSWK